MSLELQVKDLLARAQAAAEGKRVKSPARELMTFVRKGESRRGVPHFQMK
jgi:hypothetical protein